LITIIFTAHVDLPNPFHKKSLAKIFYRCGMVMLVAVITAGVTGFNSLKFAATA
jgi:hypothetical protein